MMNIEELLNPVSPDSPCGNDPAYSAELRELETLAPGKPEVAIGTVIKPYQEPDWRDLRERSVKLLKTSRHLRVPVILSVALLELDGFPGFRQGVQLLQGLLQKYWDQIYPRLDPADKLDPTERINILNSLAAPLGTFQDPYRVLQRLQRAPLCQSKAFGKVTFEDILAAQNADGPEAAQKRRFDAAQLKAAFKLADAEALKQNHEAVARAREAVEGIDEFVRKTVGAQLSASLDPLTSLLKQLEAKLASSLGLRTDAAANSAVERPASGAVPATAVGQNGFTGAVTTREDVVRALDAICDYYKRSEPSSPIPYLLRRTQRLVQMNFVEIVNELTPDALAQLKLILGKDTGDGVAQ